jgi:transposase
MPTVAEVADAVLGADTHRDTHELELATPAGRALATLQIPNSEAGYTALLDWVRENAAGPAIVAGVEGTRSYGIGLARALAAAGITVVEVDPAKHDRRGKGKTDAMDAHHAALAVLRMDITKLPTPRADGDREALRILLNAREEMIGTQTSQANRLHALLLAGDDRDKEFARASFTAERLNALARRRQPADASREQAIRHGEIRRLSTSLRTLRTDLEANRKTLLGLVNEVAPGLTDRRGIGPISAAQALISFSHLGRCRSEAAFAKLSGTCPIPASSGQTTRHRLNRGGDRDLNRAIHAIALTRMRCCHRTRAYVARRTAEGKTKREIRRCLKRYIARELFRVLAATGAGAAAA